MKKSKTNREASIYKFQLRYACNIQHRAVLEIFQCDLESAKQCSEDFETVLQQHENSNVKIKHYLDSSRYKFIYENVSLNWKEFEVSVDKKKLSQL